MGGGTVGRSGSGYADGGGSASRPARIVATALTRLYGFSTLRSK